MWSTSLDKFCLPTLLFFSVHDSGGLSISVASFPGSEQIIVACSKNELYHCKYKRR